MLVHDGDGALGWAAMRPVALAFAFCMACGGGNKRAATAPTPDPIPKTAGPDCSAVSEHLLTLLEKDSAGNADKGAGAQIKEHCTADAWGDDARSCFATAQSDDEAEGCLKLLTDSQNQAFTAMAKKSEPPAAMSETTSVPPASADKPKPKPTTRGAVKKDKPKRDGDPCQGGE